MSDTPRTIDSSIPCIRCGYDLRGVEVNGTCPECGATAVESLVASRAITKREVAELFCRILAVWMAFYGGIQLVQIAIQYTAAIFDPANNLGASWVIRIWVSLASYLLLAVLLWWASPWIARHMFSLDGPAIPAATWTGRDLMAVAVCLLGLYLIATGAEKLAGNFFGEAVNSVVVYGGTAPTKISSGVRVLTGLLMVVNRRHLAWWLHKARTAGTPQA